MPTGFESAIPNHLHSLGHRPGRRHSKHSPSPRGIPVEKRKGAFVSESALHFDGDKPNFVVRRSGRDDHLSRPTCVNRPRTRPAVSDYRSRTHDATIPEDQPRKDSGPWRTGSPPSVLSCTTWGFSCLANYSASGELLPRLFTLACTSLPKNRRCLFCDTFRQPRLAPGPPACSTRHAAVWCSDFPLVSLAARQRSSAIARNLSQVQAGKNRMNLESRKP
jgi:hypothetical protein